MNKIIAPQIVAGVYRYRVKWDDGSVSVVVSDTGKRERVQGPVTGAVGWRRRAPTACARDRVWCACLSRCASIATLRAFEMQRERRCARVSKRRTQGSEAPPAAAWDVCVHACA